jgi:hypothetical protein
MPSILNATTSSGLVTSADNSGSLQLATNNGTTALTIDTSQNVGIGTSSPTKLLSVRKTQNAETSILVQNESTGTAGKAIIRFGNSNGENVGSVGALSSGFTPSGELEADGFYVDSARQSLNLSSSNNGIIKFFGAGTERMRIDGSGVVCVGTTSAQSAKFSVDCTTGNSFAAFFKHNTSGGATLGVNAQNPTSTHVQWYNSGTPTGTVTWNGANAVAYNTSSDYRLKKDIAPMIGALDKVALLKPVTYKWKLDDSDGQGFIAHELAEVCPDAVSGKKDAMETYKDEDGNEQTRIKPQGIDTSFLVATLTAAIQELNAKVEAQAVRIAELEGAK